MLGQEYKFQITSFMSILHRVTGISLAVGGFLFAGWLLALAAGGDTYACVAECLASLPGKVLLFGFTLALVYHFLNGIRHLLWDAGWGFEIPKAYASGYAVWIVGIVLTIVIWAVALGGGA